MTRHNGDLSMYEILRPCVENQIFYPIFLIKIAGLTGSHFSFLSLTDLSIRIWQALSKIFVSLFKNIFEFWFFWSIDMY